MATTVNAGRVRFVSRGTYNNSTQYYLFDLVDYNGSSYIAKENTVGNLPTNTQYWQLIAEKGNTGSTGQTGPIGPTGNGIESIDKTSTVGLVDTYTITYTDGTTTTFTVTNGEDGEVTQAQFDELQQEVEDLENNQIILDATPNTSLYITDSASAKNRSIGITGRKEQESTTGTQLFDYDNNTISGLTKIPTYGYNKSSSNTWASGSSTTMLKSNTAYTLKCNYKQNGTQTTIGISIKEVGGSGLRETSRSGLNGTFIVNFTTATITNIIAYFYSNFTGTAVESNCDFTNIQIVEGTYTSETMPTFEEFTGRNSFTKSIISTNNI